MTQSKVNPVAPKAARFIAALACAALLTPGCTTGPLALARAPSASARLVQKWAFAEFASEVEGKAPAVNVSSAAPKPPDSPVFLVPVQAISRDAFAEMKQLSRPGDEVSEFVDASDGRYFFCLTRDGQIVKAYEFENRPQSSVSREG